MPATLECYRCPLRYDDAAPRWRCDCGAPLRLETARLFPAEGLDRRPRSPWRYHEALGIGDPKAAVTLGEGFTPLIEHTIASWRVLLKLDYLSPTGSFKDRGSAVLLAKLGEWGITSIVEDSSGNAGASIAAYAARAGIAADVYVPAAASPGKLGQIAMYGAKLHRISGTREETTAAAMKAASRSFYASHNWSPHFVAGLKTLAYEIAEQLGWRSPDWVLTPVGGGSLVLGLHQGFADLFHWGFVDRVPRIAAVQAAACAPLYEAWRSEHEDVAEVEKRPTAAEGIAIARPIRGREILQAIRASRGIVRTVEEEAIWDATRKLARAGVYVEPTAAAAAAAAAALAKDGTVRLTERGVIILTGDGLKASAAITAHFFGRKP